MAILQDINVTVSIDGLVMDCTSRIDDLKLSNLTKITNYNLKKVIPIKDLTHTWKEIQKRTICRKYNLLYHFENPDTNNKLWVCANRKNNQGEKHLLPSAMLSFGSNYFHPLKYEDVSKIVAGLEKKYNVGARISIVHLACDFQHNQKINLHKRVLRSIKAGKKRKPTCIGTTRYFGSPTSSNQIVAYDKILQLNEKKGKKIDGDISRVEIRMDVHRMNNFVASLEEVGSCNWSFLYGKYLSFHHPTNKLKKILGKNDSLLPVWEMKNIADKRHKIKPSNFYRDYMREHKWFSSALRNALDTYRWNPNSQ